MGGTDGIPRTDPPRESLHGPCPEPQPGPCPWTTGTQSGWAGWVGSHQAKPGSLPEAVSKQSASTAWCSLGFPLTRLALVDGGSTACPSLAVPLAVTGSAGEWLDSIFVLNLLQLSKTEIERKPYRRLPDDQKDHSKATPSPWGSPESWGPPLLHRTWRSLEKPSMSQLFLGRVLCSLSPWGLQQSGRSLWEDEAPLRQWTDRVDRQDLAQGLLASTPSLFGQEPPSPQQSMRPGSRPSAHLHWPWI